MVWDALRAAAFPFLRGRFLGGSAQTFSLSLSLSLEISRSRARGRDARDFDAFVSVRVRFGVLTARTFSLSLSSFLSSFLYIFRPPMRVFPSFPGETAS